MQETLNKFREETPELEDAWEKFIKLESKVLKGGEVLENECCVRFSERWP